MRNLQVCIQEYLEHTLTLQRLMAKIRNKSKLVYFHYPTPITKAKYLPDFDKFPLCVVLDIAGDTILCINTHHIPRTAAKSRLISWLLDNSRRLKSRIIPLLYAIVKADPRLQGSLPAIRRYRKSLIRGIIHQVDRTELFKMDHPSKVRLALLRKYPKKIMKNQNI